MKTTGLQLMACKALSFPSEPPQKAAQEVIWLLLAKQLLGEA